MDHAATNRRQLAFAVFGALLIFAMALGPGATAEDPHLQTFPFPTPRTTLPPPGSTPPIPTAEPTSGVPPARPTDEPRPPSDNDRINRGLVLNLDATHPDVLPGDEVTYEQWLSNDTSTAITGLLIAGNLDPALRAIEISAIHGSAEVRGQYVAVNMGTLEPQQAAVVLSRTVVREDVALGHIILNQAIAYHNEGQTRSKTVAVGLPPVRLPATGRLGRGP